jgi:hypothetical protein
MKIKKEKNVSREEKLRTRKCLEKETSFIKKENKIG